jgi:hypothetical protein
MEFLINNKLIKKNSIAITAIFTIFLLAVIVWAADNAPSYVAGSAQKNQSTVYSMMKVNFTSNWTDDTTLKNWTFETNNSGSWVNSTVVNFGTAASGSNITGYVLLVNANPGTNVSWRVWAVDNQTNLASTTTQYFVVADNQPPLWTAATLLASGQSYYSGTMNFMSNWTDNTTLSSYILEINQSAVYTNATSVAFGSNGMTLNTITISAAEGVIVSWRVWANDTSNNWNVTDTQTFTAGAVPSSSGTPIGGGSSGGSSSSTPKTKANYTNYTYICTDTDYAGAYPTINYNKVGTVAVVRSDGVIMYTGTDFCMSSATADLTEYSCATSRSISLGQVSTKCQYGCSNGACLQQAAPGTSCAEDSSLPGCSTEDIPRLATPIRSRSPSTNSILWVVGGAIGLVLIGMIYSSFKLKKKK